MDSVNLTIDEVDHVDEIQINGLHLDYEYFKTALGLDDFAFNVEHCKNLTEFLVLTKMDFEQECYIKKRMYGKEFENMDCPSLVRNYLHAVTLLHMFNDDFTFVDLNLGYILCSSMHGKGRLSLNQVVPPCKLAKIRLMMMAFVHSQIQHVTLFSRMHDSDIHKQIGNKIFFHDRLIECWMCELNLDVVSECFSTKVPSSSSYHKECKDFIKQNIFIIFDKITWNLEMGEERLLIYVYDGDHLTSRLHKKLTNMSEQFDDHWFAVNHEGLKENVQNRSLQVIRVSRHFCMIDVLHDPKSRFNYVSTVSGIVLNRQIERRAVGKNYRDTSYLLFSFFMALFCQSLRNEFNFNTAPSERIEQVDGIGWVHYISRFDVSADSHIRCTLSYDSNVVRTSNFACESSNMADVYKSPILNVSVDMDNESNGYYLGVKGLIWSMLYTISTRMGPI